MAFTPVITTEGAAYLASVIANQGNVSIKSVKYSSTNYSGSEAALTVATFLGVFKTDSSPSASVEDATTISISTACDNVGITVATSLYSIGIIADDNGTDRLLCVCTTTTPDTVNPFATSASYLHYAINLAVSSTANITVSGSVAGALYVSDIVNSLTSTSTTKPLAAAMGKALNDSKAETITYTATIPVISGTSANVTVSGILATDNPIVDINWSGSETDTQRDDILEAWGCVYRISTSANTITVYVLDATTATIPIQLKVVR